MKPKKRVTQNNSIGIEICKNILLTLFLLCVNECNSIEYE